eukprot:UN18193
MSENGFLRLETREQKPIFSWLGNRRFRPWWRVGSGKAFSRKKKCSTACGWDPTTKKLWEKLFSPTDISLPKS